MNETRDWLDTPTVVGSQIVYPVGNDSSLHNVLAVVKEIYKDHLIVRVIRDQANWTKRAERKLTRLDRFTTLSGF